MYLLAQGTEPKGFPRVTYNTGRDQRAPFQFFRHCETLFREIFPPKCLPFNLFRALRQNGC